MCTNKPEFFAQLAEMFLEIRSFSSSSDYFLTCDGKFTPVAPLKALNEGAARGIKFLTGTTADE